MCIILYIIFKINQKFEFKCKNRSFSKKLAKLLKIRGWIVSVSRKVRIL